MKLIERIKEYINSKKENDVIENNKNITLLYQSIVEELTQYKELYFEEVKKLNGHPHFKTKEVEEKVIELINEDERVLLLTDKKGRNVGFDAAELELEEIVIRVLDNHEASTMQDNQGQNLGMVSAINGLSKATYKALDNSVASVQIDYNGNNIGMFCPANCDEVVSIKALDNKEASMQLGGLSYNYNIGMLCAERGLLTATLKALDNEEASTQQNMLGQNIGMLAAINGLEEAVLKALDNDVARMQTDRIGRENMSLIATRVGMLKAVSKSLDYKDVRWYSISKFRKYAYTDNLKKYIDEYITDENIIQKCERLYTQDGEELVNGTIKENIESNSTQETAEFDN